MSKHGYLPARIFGYGFALFAFMRGEHSPSWAKHLRLDAASPLRDGLRFLRRTGDSLFHPDTIRADRTLATAGQFVNCLRAPSPSIRLSTLWELMERAVRDAELAQAVIRCLDDREPAVGAAACRTLGAMGGAAAGAVPALIRALSSADDDTRAGAAFALGVLGEQVDAVIPELAMLLEDENRTVVYEAAQALWRFKSRAEASSPRLLAAFNNALIQADHQLIEMLAATLLVISPDATRLVREHFAQNDPELRQLAMGALEEQRGISPAR
jgi:HEAT repeat protein